MWTFKIFGVNELHLKQNSIFYRKIVDLQNNPVGVQKPIFQGLLAPNLSIKTHFDLEIFASGTAMSLTVLVIIDLPWTVGHLTHVSLMTYSNVTQKRKGRRPRQIKHTTSLCRETYLCVFCNLANYWKWSEWPKIRVKVTLFMLHLIKSSHVFLPPKIYSKCPAHPNFLHKMWKETVRAWISHKKSIFTWYFTTVRVRFLTPYPSYFWRENSKLIFDAWPRVQDLP